MIPLLIYKNLHLLGVFMILVALGGLILQQIQATTREQVWRKPVAITHGIGMVLALVGGFGMLARLGIFWPWPGWVIGKIIIWLVLGVLVALIGRAPCSGQAIMVDHHRAGGPCRLSCPQQALLSVGDGPLLPLLIGMHDIGTPAYAVTGKIPPAPL